MIGQKKFDFRFYLLISCIDPLTVYIYNEGIARFCSQNFQIPSRSNVNSKFIHLTNTAVNILNRSASPEDYTQKASVIINYIQRITERSLNFWEELSEVSRSAIIAILPKILANLPCSKENSQILPLLNQRRISTAIPGGRDSNSREILPDYQRFFHILGIDILLDSELKLQLLELNDRPSFKVTVPFEKELKENLIRDCFQHVGSPYYYFENSSGWQKILPVPENHPKFETWNHIISIAKNLQPREKVGQFFTFSC